MTKTRGNAMRMTIWGLSLSLVCVPAAFGAVSAAQKCEQDLSTAAGKYQLCMDKEMGKYYGDRYASSYPRFVEKLGKCVGKYTGMWPRLVSRYAGAATACEGDRYADNGDGTFYDRLTRLTWEKKTDDNTIHDVDNVYSWSTGFPWQEDGTAFTVFLKNLNDSAFGGSNGWRCPSVRELATLLEPAYPKCTVAPCTTVPGETRTLSYRSSSTRAGDASEAWDVSFSNGYFLPDNKDSARYFRAVSGG